MRRLLWVMVVASCAKSEAPPSSTIPTGDATAEPGKGGPKSEKAEELGAVALPEIRSCVKECVGGGISAKSDEVCRTECHDQCLAQCERQATERPLEFQKRCREDCDRQLDKL